MNYAEIQSKIKTFSETYKKIFGDLSIQDVNKKYLNGELKHDEIVISDIRKQLIDSGFETLSSAINFMDEDSGYMHITKPQEAKLRKKMQTVALWKTYTEEGFQKMLEYAGYPQKKVEIILYYLDEDDYKKLKELEAEGKLYIIN